MSDVIQPMRDGEHPLYTRLRDWPDPTSEERRGFFRALWKEYEPFAPKGFPRKMQVEFHQRWWEMYLTVALLHLGLEPKTSRADKGPDLYLPVDNWFVFVEATAPTAGRTSDRVPEFVENGVAPFPHREFLLRLAQAFSEKAKRFQHYIDSKVIPGDSCCLIALSATDLNTFGTLMDGFYPEPPLCVLTGAGNMVMPIGRTCPAYLARRETISRNLEAMSTHAFSRNRSSPI